MAGRVVNEAPNYRSAYLYKLPIRHYGEKITASTGTEWIIGQLIGDSPYIYSATSVNTPKPHSAVVHFRPKRTEEIFCHKKDSNEDVEAWRQKKKLNHLGIPKYLGSGPHNCHGKDDHFFVMERYGTDLRKLFLENGRRFPEHTVYRIALQIIDILEYIHDKGYIHADVADEHLLLDMKTQNFVYLIDFHLSLPYTNKSDYQLDPNMAHRGTMQYISRDAHMGVPTMRSDFESLGYNMIQWLCNYLPWNANLREPTTAQMKKTEAFEDVSNFLKRCFSSNVPSTMMEYMNLLADIKFNETPNYKKFREILTKGLEDLGHGSFDEKLDFPRVDGHETKKKEAQQSIIDGMARMKQSNIITLGLVQFTLIFGFLIFLVYVTLFSLPI